jgi:hypothetical protein
MKCMRLAKTIIGFILCLAAGWDSVYGQKVTIGLWKMNFDYAGSYEVDSVELYNGKLKLPDTSHYWYILKARDTFEINNVRPPMELLKKENYKLLWLYHPNDYWNYAQDNVKEEFLPDGLWLNYAQGRYPYKGIFFERSVKNKQLHGKCELKNELGFTLEYFEVKDNKLHGVIILASYSKEAYVTVVDLYDSGVLVKKMYRRDRGPIKKTGIK